MGLATIIDEVTALQAFEATVLVGEECLARDGAPPRIVWVPRDDNFGPPTERYGSAQRALHTVRTAVEAHIWGADLKAAEAMRDGFIFALRQAAGPNYELQGGSWIGQANLSRGRVYVLAFTLNIPVVEPAPQKVNLTGEASDVAFQH